MADFESPESEVPEVDLRKMENVSSLVSTFEGKDLMARNVLNFFHDKRTDYVFIDIWGYVNGKPVFDQLVGFDKDKVVSLCRNIIEYFEE